MKAVIRYIADDGTEFSNEADAIARDKIHEAKDDRLAFPDYDLDLGTIEYFVAEAPPNPLWEFEVAMPTSRADAPDFLAWDDERERQRLIQWPWVWADAMLAERERRYGGEK